MDRLYIVRTADGAGILGTLTEREIRRRLDAGSLRSACECLPAGATGDLTRQWRPLWVVLGLPEPGPDDGVPAPAAPPPAPEVRDTPPPPGPATGPVGAVEIGQLLLTLGQVVCVFVCACAVLYPAFVFYEAFSNQWGFGLSPTATFFVLAGSGCGFTFGAALFVVFGRVKTISLRDSSV